MSNPVLLRVTRTKNAEIHLDLYNKRASKNLSVFEEEVLDKIQECTNQEDRIYLQWKNISFSVREKRETKSILENVSGAASPGTLTAIMGPSGAGKTTLLNILTGHYERGYDGSVLVNGKHREVKLFNKQSCYVMQDSYLLPYLTVREALMVTVELRLPSNTPMEEKIRKVNESIRNWGLARAENTRTDRLSGGEKRRLSIAQELISNPPVIFLDEPTSGLDMASSLRCVKVLKQLAANGYTIICSIHQPSTKIFNHFDQVYMLAIGKVLYGGAVNSMVPFLNGFGYSIPEHYNPADFITEIASGDYGSNFDKLFNYFSEKSPDLLPEKEMYEDETNMFLTNEEKKYIEKKYMFPTSVLQQFQILWLRCIRNIVRDKVAIPLRVFAYVCSGTLLGILYYDSANDASKIMQNTFSVVFIMLSVLFMSVMPTVILFPLEISVFLREQRNCWYSPAVYYIAKSLSDAPLQMFPVILSASIVYVLTGQPMEYMRMFSFLLVAAQTSLVSQSLGILVSSVASIQTAVFIAPAATSPFVLFGGFFVTEKLLPVGARWILKISFYYYSFQGMMGALYGFDRGPLECSTENCAYTSPQDFLTSLDVDTTHWWKNVVGLLMCDLVMRSTAYILLLWRLKRKR